MSGSQPNPVNPSFGTASTGNAADNASSGTGASDPSMEDILASIRRILSEDEPQQAAAPSNSEPSATASANEDDVLVLDSSMEVTDPPPADAPSSPAAPAPAVPAAPAPAIMDSPIMPVDRPSPASMAPGPVVPALIAPEIAAIAASAVSGLMRTLASERSTRVHTGGPTIEDLVREELRPLLKQWLDMHLPDMVERLVHAEIERVVRRAVP